MHVEKQSSGSYRWHVKDGAVFVRAYRTKRCADLCLRVRNGSVSDVDAMARELIKAHGCTATGVWSAWKHGWLGVDTSLPQALRERIGAAVFSALVRAALAQTGAAYLVGSVQREECPRSGDFHLVEARHDGVDVSRVTVCERCNPAPVAVPEPSTPVAVAPVQAPRDPRRVIATNLADLLARGEVKVARASAEAFGEDLTWTDLERVTWREWAQPAADAMGVGREWAKHSAPEHVDSAHQHLSRVWLHACETLPLPGCGVLDLRGVPESACGGSFPLGTWIDALAGTLRRSSAGAVILVDCAPDLIARCLPSYAGGAN